MAPILIFNALTFDLTSINCINDNLIWVQICMVPLMSDPEHMHLTTGVFPCL